MTQHYNRGLESSDVDIVAIKIYWNSVEVKDRPERDTDDFSEIQYLFLEMLAYFKLREVESYFNIVNIFV